MAEVYVDRGEEELVAGLLLKHADDVNHVQTAMDGPTGLMFIVPDDLHDRYLAARYGASTLTPETEAEVEDDSADEEDVEEEVEEVAPAPKRRGRPPKIKVVEPAPADDSGEEE
jgi:hypothetical protein